MSFISRFPLPTFRDLRCKMAPPAS
uniref:Uncharacterized protein n=1 Tax=Anguilla anguilla TaxID=7936 RepID=A0A0E9V5X9_ANGAN